MYFWDAASALPAAGLVLLAVALLVAFAFEFINGFHDTANAVTTVIYTRTLGPTPAVLYSGAMNFLGALVTVFLGSAAVAFSIVNLLPVDLLIDANSNAALVMVLSLLLAGVFWNLSTWYLGLPVSSSHTLIGSILGVGMAASLWKGEGVAGVNWAKAADVGLGLIVSPLAGFLAAGALLLAMKAVLREPRLYQPPVADDRPPWWVRGVLVATCGGVSFAHGSNDGQKGMGLILLVLIGFMPAHYALNTVHPRTAPEALGAVAEVRDTYRGAKKDVPEKLEKALAGVEAELGGKSSFGEVENKWQVRQVIFAAVRELKKAEADGSLPADARKALKHARTARLNPAIEFVPLWVVAGTALALGIGTTVGYKRIVVTVAEKIGKTHLTYAQGAAAESVAACTILLADVLHAPVSTTQVLSSGVAGTMAANGSGVQGGTCRRILLAWVMTLPACMLLAGLLFTVGRLLAG